MRRILIFAFVINTALLVAATAVGTLPFCDVMFNCGCTWSWAGGVSHCNVHDPATPNCPWCTMSPAVTAMQFIPILVLPLVTNFIMLRRGHLPITALAASAAVWIIVALIGGLILALTHGYPTFLWFGR